MNEVAATHEGVEESQPVISERDRLIAEIAQRNEDSIAKENEREPEKVLAYVPDETEQEVSEQNTDADPEEVTAEVKVEQKDETPAEKMVKISVDGVDMEVPASKIEEAGIRALQKETTADKRLEEATRLLRESQQMISGNKERPPSDEDLMYYAQNGTPEQQFVAKNEITRRQQATADGFVQEATRRAIEAVRVEDGAKWFMEEYKDILGDPIIAEHVAKRATEVEDRMRSGELTVSHRDAYKAIGDDTRAWVTKLRGGEKTP